MCNNNPQEQLRQRIAELLRHGYSVHDVYNRWGFEAGYMLEDLEGMKNECTQLHGQ